VRRRVAWTAYSNQRTQRWHAIQRRQYDVVIGPRSALFAPIQNIGLVVVDEEHDSSYKSDVGIKYHARDGAMMYAKQSGCPVLGSATPSVELIAAAQDSRIQRLDLPERIHVIHSRLLHAHPSELWICALNNY
jgi:primosomal protein N' (replication factor Y)